MVGILYMQVLAAYYGEGASRAKPYFLIKYIEGSGLKYIALLKGFEPRRVLDNPIL